MAPPLLLLRGAQATSAGKTMPDERLVSVVIPHFNDLERLGACLEALGRQTIDCASLEIIVADNGSTVGLAAVCAAIDGRARLVVAEEKGAGPARNAGAAAAAGRVLAFTDSDCVPDPHWIEAGLFALDSGLDLVGGRMAVFVDDAQAMTGAEAFERVFAFDNRRYVKRLGFTVTANLFCRRATFEAVGPFRAELAEDIEWCTRARGKGFCLGYAEAAVVAHPARRHWDELKRKWRRTNVERFKLAKAQRGGRARWLARNLVLPASVLVHAPRVLRSPDLPDLRTRLAALGTLARLRLWRSMNGLELALGRDG